MSVLFESTFGVFVIDLFFNSCPVACANFLKLCRVGFFDSCPVFSIQRGHTVMTGDPSGTGLHGRSLASLLSQSSRTSSSAAVLSANKRPLPSGLLEGGHEGFIDEISPKLRHSRAGCVGYANRGPNTNSSVWYVTLGDKLEGLDDAHTLFGCVAEGLDNILALQAELVDMDNRPARSCLLLRSHILHDPFDDPPRLEVLARELAEKHSARSEEQRANAKRSRDEPALTDEQRAIEAERARAKILVGFGDLPAADVKPPENVLFVCQLNPITEEKGLTIVFSRFGKVVSCEVIRDKDTGQSLCYGFIEFEDKDCAENAYFGLKNVLVDRHHIRVDFSQSVAKLAIAYKTKRMRTPGCSRTVGPPKTS